MTDTTETSGSPDALTAEEKAYFDSNGTAPLSGGSAEPPAVTDDPPPAGEAASAEAEPDPEADPAEAEADAGESGQGRVAWPQLKRERERRQAAEQKAKDAEQKARDLEERYQRDFAELARRIAPQQQPVQQAQQPVIEAPPAPPDPNTDFFAYQQWLGEQVIKIQQDKEQTTRQQQERQQRQAVTARVLNDWKTVAVKQAQDDPEFAPAYEYVTRQRVAELVADGTPPQMAAEQARQEELTFAFNKFRAGENPAVALKRIAAARGWQYRAPEPVVAADEPDAVQPTRLADLADAQAANKSIGAAGAGGSARGQLNVRSIADMGDEDFAKMFADPEKGAKKFRAAFGA